MVRSVACAERPGSRRRSFQRYGLRHGQQHRAVHAGATPGTSTITVRCDGVTPTRGTLDGNAWSQGDVIITDNRPGRLRPGPGGVALAEAAGFAR
jgi:hypothetical protein